MKQTLFNLPRLAAGLALASSCLLSSCVEPSYADNRGPSYRGGPYSPGYQVLNLPPGYRTERHGNLDYYQHGGSYYRPRQGGGYTVVASPFGAGSGYGNNHLIPRLPSGYRAYQDGNGTYYRSGSSYYRRQGNGYMPFNGPR